MSKFFKFLFSIRELFANMRVPFTNKEGGDIWAKINAKINDPKSQRRLVLVIVCIALLLDNMLYMVIVPIIPSYLREQNLVHHLEAIPTNWTNFTMNVSQAALVTTALPRFSPPDSKTKVNTPKKPADDDPNSPFYLPSDSAEGDGQPSTKQTPGVTGMPFIVHTRFQNVTDTVYKSITTYAKAYMTNEQISVGFLFATKAIFQLAVNPFTGALMDRIGYDIPMMIGLSIIFVSTVVFAFGRSYGVLFAARSLQGVGSAFADTSGLAMIADRYTETTERSMALGVALAFISFGCLVAPPFGGALYDISGKPLPFVILALLALLDGCMMLFVMKPVRKERRTQKEKKDLPKGTPIYKLIMDPYIAVCAGALVMANVSLAFLEPTISLWMKDTMNAPEWQMGMIWLPAFVPHVLGVVATVKLAQRYPNKQWVMSLCGLSLEGISCLIVPFCTSFEQLMIPISLLCFGIAIVDTAILPTLGHLVDTRHTSVYGSVYAIADISYSAAYAFGPLVAGQIVHKIGFTALNIGIFVSNIAYAPLLMMLRHIYDYTPFKNEEDLIIDDDEGSTRGMYQTYSGSSEDGNGITKSRHTINGSGRIEDEFFNLQEQRAPPSSSDGFLSHQSDEENEEVEERSCDNRRHSTVEPRRSGSYNVINQRSGSYDVTDPYLNSRGSRRPSRPGPRRSESCDVTQSGGYGYGDRRSFSGRPSGDGEPRLESYRYVSNQRSDDLSD